MTETTTVVEPAEAGIAAAARNDDASEALDVRIFDLIERSPDGATWLEIRAIAGTGAEASEAASNALDELLRADRVRVDPSASGPENPRYYAPSSRETLEDLLDEPLEQIEIPLPSAFKGKGFLRSPELARLAKEVLQEHKGKFGHLATKTIDFLWRAEGGMEGSRPRYGKVRLPSQELAHYAGKDVVVWIAADHCADADFDVETLRKLLLHLFCGVGVSEKTGALKLKAPEFRGYYYELEVYGAWTRELKLAAAKLRQMSLFEEQADEGEQADEEIGDEDVAE